MVYEGANSNRFAIGKKYNNRSKMYFVVLLINDISIIRTLGRNNMMQFKLSSMRKR